MWIFNDNYNGVNNGNGGGTLWGSRGLRIFSDNDNYNNIGEVILSTDRSLVVLQFCKGAEKVLSMGDLWDSFVDLFLGSKEHFE